MLQDCWLALVDPGDPTRTLGRVRVSVRATTPEALERRLWRELLALADLDGDGALSAEEFASLLEVGGAKI